MKSSALKVIPVIMLMLAVLFAGTVSFASDDVPETAEAADVTASDRDAYCYGLIGYAQRDQLIRSLPKKSVAYVTQILDGANRVVTAGEVVKGRYYRYSLVEGINTFNPEAIKSYSYLAGITYDYFSDADPDMELQEVSADGEKTPYYVVSADELMNADIIVTIGCIPVQTMVDSLDDRLFPGIIISELPRAFSHEEPEDEKALTQAFYLGCAFSEVLNPVELCAYYYEHFLGFEDRDKLTEAVDSAFKATEFFRDYDNKLGSGYDAGTVGNMIINGTYFYLDNRDVFSGGAFDENGMSSWEPDFELAGSILGPKAAADEPAAGTEPETETETETDTEPESETEPVTETETETEPETETETETEPETETETEATAPETTTEELVPVVELPSWIGAVFAAPVVIAGLIIYVIYVKKKD